MIKYLDKAEAIEYLDNATAEGPVTFQVRGEPVCQEIAKAKLYGCRGAYIQTRYAGEVIDVTPFGFRYA